MTLTFWKISLVRMDCRRARAEAEQGNYVRGCCNNPEKRWGAWSRVTEWRWQRVDRFWIFLDATANTDMLEDYFGGIIERNQRMTPKQLEQLEWWRRWSYKKGKMTAENILLGNGELILDPLNTKAQISIKKLVYQVCIWEENLGWMYDFGVSR